MKNLHIEHPEDTIFTGDLSVLDWFKAEGQMSVKIDGAPAIVWGKDPATGTFFVGTKSVFNKKKIKINHSHEEIEQNHEGEVASFFMIALIAFLTSMASFSVTLLVMAVMILILPTRSLTSFLK